MPALSPALPWGGMSVSIVTEGRCSTLALQFRREAETRYGEVYTPFLDLVAEGKANLDAVARGLLADLLGDAPLLVVGHDNAWTLALCAGATLPQGAWQQFCSGHGPGG